MKYLFLFVLAGNSMICYSQNLVPNPGFEDHTKCPAGRAQFQYVTGWNGSFAHEGNSNCDYYHRCSGNFSVPHNPDGDQEPAGGDAYTGLLTYYSIIPEIRGYMSCKLTKPVVKGNRYVLSFKAVSMDYGPRPVPFLYFSNGLGAKLTTWDPELMPPRPDNKPHMYAKQIMNDTVHWVLIMDTITADSDYNYLVLGNFFDDAHTLVQSPPPQGNHIFGARYYIDDVELREIAPLVKVSQYAICRGDSVTISVNYTGPFYWSLSSAPNDTFTTKKEFTIAPDSSVKVLLHIPGSVIETAIRVDESVTLPGPKDTLVCGADYYVLDVTLPGISYAWNDGPSAGKRFIRNTGIYTVRSQRGSCYWNDTFNIRFCRGQLFVPNAFTPDHDGLNDEFRPEGSRIKDFRMVIYDRWGRELFKSTDLFMGWNGKEGNDFSPAENYVWMIQYNTLDDDQLQKMKGVVTLLR